MPELFLVMALSTVPGLVPPRPMPMPVVSRPMLVPADLPRTRPAAEPDTLARLGFRDDGVKQIHGRDLDLEWAKLKSKVSLFGPVCNIPLQRSGWATEESLKFSLNQSLFVVGRVGANSEWVESQQYKVVGVTGLGVKLPVGGELQVRGGRSMTNYDPDDLVLIPDQAQTFLQISTRWSLPGQLNLEFTTEAIPAQASVARDVLKRDLKLAMPLSNSGEIHVGAKYRYEGETTPWIDRMKLYFGLQFKR